MPKTKKQSKAKRAVPPAAPKGFKGFCELVFENRDSLKSVWRGKSARVSKKELRRFASFYERFKRLIRLPLCKIEDRNYEKAELIRDVPEFFAILAKIVCQLAVRGVRVTWNTEIESMIDIILLAEGHPQLADDPLPRGCISLKPNEWQERELAEWHLDFVMAKLCKCLGVKKEDILTESRCPLAKAGGDKNEAETEKRPGGDTESYEEHTIGWNVCDTPERLYETIEFALNCPSTAFGTYGQIATFAKRCAIRLRKQNPKFTPVPQNFFPEDIMQWCIDNQRKKDEPSTAEQKLSEAGEETKKHKKELKPLSEKAAAVLELLKTAPEHRGMTGPKILEALDKKNILIDQSTLTKNIIPELKPYGVKNRPRIGYYIEQ